MRRGEKTGLEVQETGKWGGRREKRQRSATGTLAGHGLDPAQRHDPWRAVPGPSNGMIQGSDVRHAVSAQHPHPAPIWRHGKAHRPPAAPGEPLSPPGLLQGLRFPPFRQRPPWWGADLQTLRDTLRGCRLEESQPRHLVIPVDGEASLLACLDSPPDGPPRALALLSHGLGGSSEAEGPRRLAATLCREGFAVLRLNLRGAGAGRDLAPGSYAADCSSDLLPVLQWARTLAGALARDNASLPLVGAGISLGGTILLNACAAALRQGRPGLDALVCISSPLDLPACSRQFERPRNGFYQRWLVRRLRREVLADHLGLCGWERQALSGANRPRSIRTFDALITAPRWGYDSVEAYYAASSPMAWLGEAPPLPPTLLLHAGDDPWVPVAATRNLEQRLQENPASLPRKLRVCITAKGGHNGFHGVGDAPWGSWGDRLSARWLGELLESLREG